jgi:hypothetical protein
MTVPALSSRDSSKREAARDVGTLGAATTGVGAALLTIVAGACCVSPVLAPLIVGVLGASGAVWAASLKPYSLLILAIAGLSLAVGFWSVYRPRPACAIGEVPTRRRLLSGFAKTSLWIGAVCWTAALMLRFLLPQ